MRIMRIKKYRVDKTSAQSTLEYAVVIACVVAALLGMQFYLKRGIQGKLRQAGDEIGEQYAPTNVQSNITTETKSTTTVTQELVPLSKEENVPLFDQYGLPVYGLRTKASIDEKTEKKDNSYEKLGAFENGLF